ncbi:MAG TPA: redoxin domain-containing protein [Candidatus Sulfotelmatobacter sp.]|nr:redoxin domain-containing protein [Candidatus Sulfotelmatobacter sp.]
MDHLNLDRLRSLAVVCLVLGAAVIAVLAVVQQPPSPWLPSGPLALSSDLAPTPHDRAEAKLDHVDAWINSWPLRPSELRGKVLLVNFWNFACAQCLRTLPHIAALRRRFSQDDLVVIGVHTPEFDFERSPATVAAAAQRLGVVWPVAVDNHRRTWRSFDNTVWPADYLVDRAGRIAYRHLGAGGYDSLIAATSAVIEGSAVSSRQNEAALQPGQVMDVYAGSERGSLANDEGYPRPNKVRSYADKSGTPPQPGQLLLTGSWSDRRQYLHAHSDGHVRLRFRGKQVFLVAGTSSGAASPVSISVDNRSPSPDGVGAAVNGDRLVVDHPDLYEILRGLSPGDHLLELAVPAGLDLYLLSIA